MPLAQFGGLLFLLLKKASQQLMAKPIAKVITLWRGDAGERDSGGERSRELLCMPKIAPACLWSSQQRVSSSWPRCCCLHSSELEIAIIKIPIF